MINDLDNKAGVYCREMIDLSVGLILRNPAMIYICSNGVNDIGFVKFSFGTTEFFVTTGGIKQNNTHYLPRGTKIDEISNLDIAKICYFD